MNPRTWTLSTKLIASLVVLFIAVTTAIGGAIVLVMRHVLTGQIDDQLRRVADTATDSHRSRDDFPRDADRPFLCHRAPPNAGEGFLQACLANGTASGYVVQDGHERPLSANTLGLVHSLQAHTDPIGVEVDGLGDYRVLAARTDSGTTVVCGMPLRLSQSAVGDLLRYVSLFSIGGLLIAIAAGTWLVRANLRPLQRVAGTATRVSRLPLSSGEVDLSERVDTRDTDRGTEVGQVGAALNDLLDHVAQSLRVRHESETRLRQFVADASHELRTPLASIMGYAELTRREPAPVPPAVIHAISRIESESTRMACLVEDMLLLARLDAGRPLAREPVDLTRLAIDAVSDLRAAGAEHSWRLDLPEESVDVTGDPARLTQVVLNLLTNARVHTPTGTTVTARVRRSGPFAQIDVLDNGPGIPTELLPHVFARFTRGDEARTRTHGSSGLGLSIVQAVVAAHGGTVGVTSRPGHTEFQVRLPADETTDPPSA